MYWGPCTDLNITYDYVLGACTDWNITHGPIPASTAAYARNVMTQVGYSLA
jgi:hypothetical protein